MVDVKGFNGGMNQDSAPELLPAGDYTYAMNISNGSEGIVNLLGNRPAGGFPANPNPGNEWICGAFFDKVRQRIIYFTNHERGNHRILSYEVPSTTSVTGKYIVLFQDNATENQESILVWPNRTQYSPDALIKDIKVIHREMEGDLYYFIDPLKKLRKFNYNTLQSFKTGDTTLCAFGWTNANYTGTTFRDGTLIPQVTDTNTWAGLTTPAWCYYDNNPANDDIYGRLYNWYAISDPRGFAPVGYRVPTKTDWDNLIDCLGGVNVAGGKLKSKSTLWNTPNSGATNESFFAAIPAATRNPNGSFDGLGSFAYWWTSTELNANSAYLVGVVTSSPSTVSSTFSKKTGFSVRLIKEI